MTENGELVCKKGDVIVAEGDYGSGIYKLLAGGAAVFANYGGDGETLLAELRAGDYFGEMAVIEITCRSATVVASEDDTRIAVVDASDLSGYLSGHRGEINGIARHLSRRLRALTADYTEVCDTLRELGRLDTSADRVSEGLLARIGKFARVFLAGSAAGEPAAAPATHVAAQRCDRALAVSGAAYRAGDVIFREAAESDCMYYIYDGRVGVYTGYGTERQKLLAELTPEMFFGEMGLFEGLSRTATAVALENGTYVELIREKDLDTILEKEPALALRVLQHLSSRLRALTADYLKACGALAETEKELAEREALLTPEMLVRAQYMTQLLLAPEILF